MRLLYAANMQIICKHIQIHSTLTILLLPFSLFIEIIHIEYSLNAHNILYNLLVYRI